jgi:translation initiation factor 2D
MNLPFTDPSVQMKKTSWKKALKFFKAMEKKELVKTRERSGELVLTSLAGKENDEVKNFILFKPKSYTASSTSAQTASSSNKKDSLLNAKEYWRPQHAAVPLFEHLGLSATQYFPVEGLKQVITEYIKANYLINKENPKLVNIDSILSKALSTGLANTIGRDKLVSSLQKNCSIFHTINQPGETNAKISKGPVPQVKVYVERRTRGKLATRILNLEAFQLNPIAIAEELRVACAGSATVNTIKEGSDLKEVMVQGSQTKAVVKLLESKGLRNNWIDVHEKK